MQQSRVTLFTPLHPRVPTNVDVPLPEAGWSLGPQTLDYGALTAVREELDTQETPGSSNVQPETTSTVREELDIQETPGSSHVQPETIPEHQLYLVVDVVSTHSDGVHDILPSLIFSGGTIRHVVWVVFCSKVVTELVSGHQVCFLWRPHQRSGLLPSKLQEFGALL